MVQPQTPPLSIRPRPDLLARVDAYAKRHGMKRHGAILALIERGLAKKDPEAAQPRGAEVCARRGGITYPLCRIAGAHEIPAASAEAVGVPSYWWRDLLGAVQVWPKPAADIELIIQGDEVRDGD